MGKEGRREGGGRHIYEASNVMCLRALKERPGERKWRGYVGGRPRNIIPHPFLYVTSASHVVYTALTVPIFSMHGVHRVLPL